MNDQNETDENKKISETTGAETGGANGTKINDDIEFRKAVNKLLIRPRKPRTVAA